MPPLLAHALLATSCCVLSFSLAFQATRPGQWILSVGILVLLLSLACVWRVLRRNSNSGGSWFRALTLPVLLILALLRGALAGEFYRGPVVDWQEGEERGMWVEGRVTDEPRFARHGARLLLRIESTTDSLVQGLRASVWFDSTAGIPRRGSRIIAFLELRKPRSNTTPGGFDERGWLASLGASLSGRCRGLAWAQQRPAPPSLHGFLRETRFRWSRNLEERLPGAGGAFLRGLVLGERGRVTPEAIDDFRRAGVLHLLALSGQHVGLVVALISAVAQLARLGLRQQSIWTGAGVWFYALLTGASPSVCRASTSTSLRSLAHSYARNPSGFEILGWSAALGILVSPNLGLHFGFQLSCLASAGLITAATITQRFRDQAEAPLRLESGFGRGLWLRRGLKVIYALALLPVATLFAQAAVLPLLAYRFGAVSLVGLVSNLVLVPMAAVLLTLTLPLLVLEACFPMPGILWRVLALGTSVALETGEWFSRWPGASTPCTLSATECTLAILFAGFAVWVFSVSRFSRDAASTHNSPYLAGAACAALGLWASLLAGGFTPQHGRGEPAVRYWMLDVGQGDGQVLEFPDGRVLVIDVGDARESFDAGARVLAPFLRARGHREIDCVVITHEDRDHVGGLVSVCRELPVSRIASGEETLAALEKRNHLRFHRGSLDTVSQGETLLSGPGYRVTVLWPPAGVTELAANERSVVLEVQVDHEVLLLTGDADSTAEEQWLERYQGRVDYLKLGHHGSRSSTGLSILQKTRPRLALISCGRSNRFQHPHPETLERLSNFGIGARRTDQEGSVLLVLGRPRKRTKTAPPTTTPQR